MVSSLKSAVKLIGVAKRYSDVIAVDNHSLDVKRGEIFGLLGPKRALDRDLCICK